MGKYYSDDSGQRKRYFEDQFFALANQLAKNQGLTLSAYFNGLKDFTSFKTYLETVFSADGSLENYYSGMDDNELKEFFNRSKIQDVVTANQEEEEEAIDKIEPPVLVQQVKKKTRRYFDATVKGKKTRGYETKIKIKGKVITKLRDARGRFVKRI